MTVEKFGRLTSNTFVLPQEDIDTDQIVPARFLTTTTRSGLGKAAFYDWRFDADGRPLNTSPFNGYDPAKQKILVAGANFGCGSSREHAPWALADFGFRVVISSPVADIFRSNSLKNGVLAIAVDKALHKRLLATPGASVTVDLERQTVVMADEAPVEFEIEPFARRCLLDGVDPLGFIMANLPAIEAFERSRA